MERKQIKKINFEAIKKFNDATTYKYISVDTGKVETHLDMTGKKVFVTIAKDVVVVQDVKTEYDVVRVKGTFDDEVFTENNNAKVFSLVYILTGDLAKVRFIVRV